MCRVISNLLISHLSFTKSELLKRRSQVDYQISEEVIVKMLAVESFRCKAFRQFLHFEVVVCVYGLTGFEIQVLGINAKFSLATLRFLY